MKKIIIVTILCSCIVMAFVDGVLQPPYYVKSIIKLCVFIPLPLLIFSISNQSLWRYFRLQKKSLLVALTLGICLYIAIVVGYFFIQTFIDFSNITYTLNQTMNVNKDNFLLVALYISFINSFLEEFFFRGFAFLYLKTYTSRKVAYLISAFAFSLYHTAMMIGWFSPIIFVASLIALAGAGILFNWLDEKYTSIYPSWLVHLFANLGINTVGLLLFHSM